MGVTAHCWPSASAACSLLPSNSSVSRKQLPPFPSPPKIPAPSLNHLPSQPHPTLENVLPSLLSKGKPHATPPVSPVLSALIGPLPAPSARSRYPRPRFFKDFIVLTSHRLLNNCPLYLAPAYHDICRRSLHSLKSD